MHKSCLFALAFAGVFFTTPAPAQFAAGVVSYSPGAGVAAGYDDPTRALGAPTTFIGYQDADPFNPPYRKTDLVSVGAGGSLTLQFNTPIQNDPGHAFGLDFIIFGNAGFIITNGDYTGGGITDGSLFAASTGVTRIWVSDDNVSYYLLNPAVAPTVDTLFPTDSSGNFHVPVNPALGSSDFAGRDLGGIRSLYAGSGGGLGFDISWAQDGGGQGVSLSEISFVRIDVLSDKSEIDAISAVPEPSVWALGGLGALGWLVVRQRRS